MKILDVSLQTNLSRFEAGRTHTLSLSTKLALLGNDVLLLIGGNRSVNCEINLVQTSVLRYFPLADQKTILRKLMAILGNNWLLMNQLIRMKFRQDRIFDVIYERHSLGLFSCLLCSKVWDIPLIYEVNGIPDEEIVILFNIHSRVLKFLIYNLIKYQLHQASRNIVQTPELKTIISSRYQLDNVAIVSNGAEIGGNLISQTNNDVPTIVYAGVLDELHNLEDILFCLTSLELGFRLYLVGEGSRKNDYMDKYREDKRIIFKGSLSHEEALSTMAGADICIASYGLQYPLFRKYGFYLCPIKLLEYLALGKATIVYGASNSLIDSFVSKGALIHANTTIDLHHYLRQLINDKDEREKMSANAEKSIRDFSWEKAACKTEQIIYEVINPHMNAGRGY